MDVTTKNPIEKWYTGKALTVIQTYVLPTLAAAEAQGYWPKGASRKVTAALNKQSVAQKFARANDRGYNDRQKRPTGLLGDIQDVRGPEGFKATLKGWELVHAMQFGQFSRAERCLTLAKALVPFAETQAESAALATAYEWAKDFAPVAALVALLDSRRPVPVVVAKTLSRTVLDNVGNCLNISLDSIEFPKIIYVWETRTNKLGEKYQVSVPEILWPEGTRHKVSRFSHGSHAGNSQCEACGHAIKNAFNWLPLVGQTPEGPVSLWVGRDCAKKLFECEVEGEADWSAAR